MGYDEIPTQVLDVGGVALEMGYVGLSGTGLHVAGGNVGAGSGKGRGGDT